MKQIIVGVKCVYLFKQLLWPLHLKTQLWAAHNNKVSITFLFASYTQFYSTAIYYHWTYVSFYCSLGPRL